MNKIFKVVWNKARNCYVVVSEVAKANGKSSVKSIAAALAVAVMMSGGVMSAEAATYVEAQGSIITVTQNTQNPVKDYVTGNGERVVGGWNSMSGVTATTLNSNITVTGGEYNMIVGGNYTGNNHNVTVESTTVTIDGATVKQFIGGTGFNGVDGADNAANRTTNVTIDSGYFGTAADNTNVPEKHVVAGDLLKTGATNQTVTSTIKDTQLTINDGTFDAAVYGGSAAIRYYAGYTSGEVKATVENAQIDITGGAFNDAIVAGGLASGYGTDSIVKNAQVNISGENGGLDINGDIFAGGMDGSLGAGFETAISKVEKATVNIDNATVNNVYGSGGNIISKQNGSAYSWEYKQNTDADAVVDTDLTLDNVTANTVDIAKGSISLKGENTVDIIKAADTKISMVGTDGKLNAQVSGGDVDLGDGNVWNVTEGSNVTAVTGTNYEIAGNGKNLVVNNTKNIGDANSNGIYSSGTATISGLDMLDVTSANRHAIEVGTDMTIEANGIKLNAVNGNGAMVYGDLTVKADDMAIHAQNGHGIRAAADDGHAATVDIDVDRLTITADNALETAIKVSDGASVDVTATDTANINGQILAEVDSTVALSGGTVNVTSVEDALDTFGGTIDVAATNINITSTNKDGIQADDATVTLKGENVTVEGKTWGIKNIDETNSNVVVDGTNVTITGAEDNAIWAMGSGDGKVVVNATDTANINGQVYVEIDSEVALSGGTVNVTSVEDALDTFGGTINVDADEINITSTNKDGIQADDATVTLKGENVTVAGGAWGIKNIDETNSNVVVDGTNITIKGGTDADEGAIWAMGAGDGEVTVNATGTADIQGEVNVDIGAAVTLKGGTVNVAGGAEDALDACGGTIDVDATNINITSETNDGIQANDATITLDGENVTIDAGNWAIKNLDETDSDVTINATGDVTIKGDAGAIMTSENGSGSVTVNGMGTTTIEGNIKAASNGNVSVLLNTADSLLDGDVTTTNGTTTITMNDGATWKVTGTSNVSEIAGAKGTIMVDTVQDGLVTIGNNTNADLTLNIADGGNIGVDVEEGLKEMVKTVDVKQGNGINNLVVDEFTLKAAAKEVDGKVTTTIKPGDEFVVESDVIATGDVKAAGDVFAGDVSLQDTKAQADANAKDIAANKEAIARGDVVNQVQNTQIAQLQSKDIELGNAIADETAARKAADKALQTQVETNAGAIAANAAGIQQNENAIAGLNNRVTSLDGRVDKVGAGAAALAALHPLDYDAENKLSFSAGVGNYAGQTAAAVGAFYRPNEDVMFSIGGTAGNGENMVNAGVSFAIGKGSSGVAKMSKAELVQEVTNMKAENEELKQENKDIRNELNKLKELVMKLAEK